MSMVGNIILYYCLTMAKYVILATSLIYLTVSHLILYFNHILVDTYEEYVQIITRTFLFI